MQGDIVILGYPGPWFTGVLFTLLGIAMLSAILLLLGFEDPVRLKQLIEDDGPVQGAALLARGH